MSPQTVITLFTLSVRALLLASADTYFTTEGDSFLGRVVPTRPIIHVELESALRNSRRGDVERRLARLEEQLLPTFEVLPKNEHGRLESPVVRYLLHRHFLRRHAWLMNGLAPDGAGWSSTSPDMILEGHVPQRVHEILRDHLEERGLDLHETAVLGALLENKIHEDAVSRLHGIWWQHVSMLPHSTVSMKEMQVALDIYMLSYIPGIETAHKSTKEMIKDAVELYPTFNRTQSFVYDMIHKKVNSSQQTLHISDAEQIVVDISENYGAWQEAECKALKRDLLALQQVRPGYADLRAFYRKALVDGYWQFAESVPYLQSLGALDESTPQRPAVLISNYMNSPSQYIGTSHFYSVSCLDECEPILANIEAEVGGPYATAEQVMGLKHRADLAHRMQNLPAALSRLEQIAGVHNGKIPLHGRLFQQWLHLLYPAECAYPHVAGSTRAETPDEFEKRTNISTVQTAYAMRAWIKDWNGAFAAMAAADGARWDMQEELLTSSKRAITNLDDFLLSRTALFRFGCPVGLLWLVLVLVAKTAFYGAIPGTASAGLLSVQV